MKCIHKALHLISKTLLGIKRYKQWNEMQSTAPFVL